MEGLSYRSPRVPSFEKLFGCWFHYVSFKAATESSCRLEESLSVATSCAPRKAIDIFLLNFTSWMMKSAAVNFDAEINVSSAAGSSRAVPVSRQTNNVAACAFC